MFKNKKKVPFLSNEENVMRMLNNMSGVFSTKKSYEKCRVSLSFLYSEWSLIQYKKQKNKNKKENKNKKPKKTNPSKKKTKAKQLRPLHWDHCNDNRVNKREKKQYSRQ